MSFSHRCCCHRRRLSDNKKSMVWNNRTQHCVTASSNYKLDLISRTHCLGSQSENFVFNKSTCFLRIYYSYEYAPSIRFCIETVSCLYTVCLSGQSESQYTMRYGAPYPPIPMEIDSFSRIEMNAAHNGSTKHIYHICVNKIT